MRIWNVVDYLGQRVMDGVESAGKGLFGLNKQEPKIGVYYWDKGEYLGDGAFVIIQYYPGCAYTEGDHVVRFQIFSDQESGDNILYSEDLECWQRPYDTEVISEDKRQSILEKIQKSSRGPFIDRGIRPYEHIPSSFPKRWIVWTQPPR